MEKLPKEYLYVGYYIDTQNRYILKIGTTNDLKRRQQEHTRNYRRSKNYTLPPNAEFTYLWKLPLSKYNTIRYEDRNRQLWQEMEIGEFIRNDRFLLSTIPEMITVRIRRDYQIALT